MLKDYIEENYYETLIGNQNYVPTIFKVKEDKLIFQKSFHAIYDFFGV